MVRKPSPSDLQSSPVRQGCVVTGQEVTGGQRTGAFCAWLVPDHRRPEESIKEREENTGALAPLVCKCLPELETRTEIKHRHCSQGGERPVQRDV